MRESSRGADTIRTLLDGIRRDLALGDAESLRRADRWAAAALAALDQADRESRPWTETKGDRVLVLDPVRVPATRNETRDTWNFDERVPGARDEAEHLDIHQADIGFGLRDYCDKCGEEWPCPQYRRATTRNEENPT